MYTHTNVCVYSVVISYVVMPCFVQLYFALSCVVLSSVVISSVVVSSVVRLCVLLGVQKAFIANNVPGEVGSTTSVSSMEQVLSVARAWGAQYFVAVRDYAFYPSDFFSQEVFSMSQS